MRRIAIRSDNDEVVIHNVAAVDAEPVGNKFVLSGAIVNKERVSVTASANRERLASSDGNHVNRDATCCRENWQNVAEQTRVLGRSGRTERDESLIGLSWSNGENS